VVLPRPDPRPNRGDQGQDRSKSRRKAHVRRGARARRSGAGRLRAAQAAARVAAGRAAADLHSEPRGRSARSGRAGAHGTGLHTDLPARPGAAAGHEGAARAGARARGTGVCTDLPALERRRGIARSLRGGPGALYPYPGAMRSRVGDPGLRELLPTGQENPPPAAEAEGLFQERCTPLCVLIPPGSPGACGVPEK
jgi:hypothetical protein